VPGWRNGIRGGLKIPCPSGRAGSTPAPGTTKLGRVFHLLLPSVLSVLLIFFVQMQIGAEIGAVLSQGLLFVLRKGTSEWTCMPGPPPGSKHDDPGCFDRVFFQWIKDGLAGLPQHIDRLGVSYMYMGQWVPGASGGEFHVGPHIMVLTPHPEDLQGFTRGGRNGTYIIHLPGPDQADKWFLVIPIHQAEKQ
jgi:hypothetical protein